MNPRPYPETFQPARPLWQNQKVCGYGRCRCGGNWCAILLSASVWTCSRCDQRLWLYKNLVMPCGHVGAYHPEREAVFFCSVCYKDYPQEEYWFLSVCYAWGLAIREEQDVIWQRELIAWDQWYQAEKRAEQLAREIKAVWGHLVRFDREGCIVQAPAWIRAFHESREEDVDGFAAEENAYNRRWAKWLQSVKRKKKAEEKRLAEEKERLAEQERKWKDSPLPHLVPMLVRTRAGYWRFAESRCYMQVGRVSDFREEY